MRGVYLQGPRSSSIGYKDGNTEVRDWSCGGSPEKNLPFNLVNPINPTHSMKHINQKNLINPKAQSGLNSLGGSSAVAALLFPAASSAVSKENRAHLVLRGCIVKIFGLAFAN